MNGIYLLMMAVAVSFLPMLQSTPMLLFNGFLVGTISVLEARPPYMDSWQDGLNIIVVELFIFAVVNVIAVGLVALARKQQLVGTHAAERLRAGHDVAFHEF